MEPRARKSGTRLEVITPSGLEPTPAVDSIVEVRPLNSDIPSSLDKKTPKTYPTESFLESTAAKRDPIQMKNFSAHTRDELQRKSRRKNGGEKRVGGKMQTSGLRRCDDEQPATEVHGYTDVVAWSVTVDPMWL